MKEFKEFIKKQGVVGLAVGFILGGAVSSVVSSLVNDIVNPIVGLFTGVTGGLENWKVILGPATISIGNFISVMIDFLIIALVVFYSIKFLGLEKPKKKS